MGVYKIENIIAAVRNGDEFEKAVNSQTKIIFHLTPNITTLSDNVKKAHSKSKKIFIHIDLAEGIGKDKYGILYAKNLGVDGIISTRTNIIKAAKELGLYTVQRFFILDSQSFNTTLEALKISKTDMAEIMPGTVTKVISRLEKEINIPLIAGGMIETEDEIEDAINNGATAVSTGKPVFWN